MSSPAPTTLRQPLIDLLLAAGCPDPAAAQALVDRRASGISWTDAVLDAGQVDETRFLAGLAALFRLPFEPRVDATRIDRATLNLFPSRFVTQHGILPVGVEAPGLPGGDANGNGNGNDPAVPARETLILATYDPLNRVGHKEAATLAGKRAVRWTVVPRTALQRTVKALYGVGAETFEEILKARGDTLEDLLVDKELISDLNGSDTEASVVKFVNTIIRDAIAQRATDIHVEPLENDLRIRYRIDGILHEAAVPGQLRLLQSSIISRLKVMARMDIAEKRLPQDGRINLNSAGNAIDVRVSTIPTVNGESISLRLLARTESQSFGFDRLDLSDEQTRLIKTLLAKPNGIILVTGPTGSGKSTSLYCFLSSINSVQRRIVTVEEPVEYRLPGVSQIDVRPEIGLTFAQGLRAILRQDPNVVMVGEIRDHETADIAIRAAMTGHLVFSTLHTNDAVGGITRLLDMDTEPFLLTSTVQAFLAQRLVRTVCPHCAEPAGYPLDYLAEIGFPLAEQTANLGKLVRGAGCDHCRQTGYQGRVAIYEVCRITDRIKRLVMQKANGSDLKAAAVADGMLTLRQDGWRRVLRGQTTIEEVVRVTQEDEALAETD